MNSHELHDRKLIYAYVENELIKAFNKLYKDYKKSLIQLSMNYIISPLKSWYLAEYWNEHLEVGNGQECSFSRQKKAIHSSFPFSFNLGKRRYQFQKTRGHRQLACHASALQHCPADDGNSHDTQILVCHRLSICKAHMPQLGAGH